MFKFKSSYSRSRFLYCLGIVLGALLLCGQLPAQTIATPGRVSESEALSHLMKRMEPVYPPIAKAAEVQGEVRVLVQVDARGGVAGCKVLSGPPMLQQATVDAVKEWQFAPFTIKGVGQPVTTVITVRFSLGIALTKKQEQAEASWFPLSVKCGSALNAENANESIDYCRQALDLSLQAGDSTSHDQVVRVESLGAYGHALLVNGKAQEALESENQAIKEAKLCLPDKDEGFAILHYWRAAANARLGDDDAAAIDFQTAEEIYRRAIAKAPEMKRAFGPYLATVLNAHAAVFDSMGRHADAEKLRAEAAAL